jgi:hypothetical protein
MQSSELVLSDAFVEALGLIAAEKQREFDQEIGRIIAIRDAEFRAFKAQMELAVRDVVDAIMAKIAAVQHGKEVRGPGPAGAGRCAGPPDAGCDARRGAGGEPAAWRAGAGSPSRDGRDGT